MVTGSPSMASKSATKSSRCSGSSASRADPRVSAVCEDQALDQHPAVAEEHVLGAAQADALRAEPAGPGGVVGGVGVGPHPQPPRGVGVAQDPVDGSHQVGRLLVGVGRRRRRGRPPGTGRPVRSSRAPHRGTPRRSCRRSRARRPRRRRCRRRGPCGRRDVDVDRLRPAHAGAAHAAGDHGGVAGLAAPAGQHPVRRRSCPRGRPGWSPGAPGSPTPPRRAGRRPWRSRRRPRPPPRPGRRPDPSRAGSGRRTGRTAGTSAAPAARR